AIEPTALTQSVPALARGETDVAALRELRPPAVVGWIAHPLTLGERRGAPVSIWGELAVDVRVTRMLLGLGLTGFAMHPQQLLDVKKEIRKAHSNALRVKVASALNRAERIDLSTLDA